MSQKRPKTMLRCPRCGQPAAWEGNCYRPFCSARCRLVDLGAWIDEEYCLPGQEAVSDGNQECAKEDR
jgi:hypothetical protein